MMSIEFSYDITKTFILNTKEFNDLSSLIYGNCGINLTPAKKVMLETRLAKRIRALQMESYGEYYDYVCSDIGRREEFQFMIDEVTTNKTDFFREPAHFEYLTQEILPAIYHSQQEKGRRKINIWSAACSSGEEPYSIAMTVSDFVNKYPGTDYSVLATDLSVKVLKKASIGIYTTQDVEPVPGKYRQKFVMKSKNPRANEVRIVPQLRSKISFRQINFLDEFFPAKRNMDIIFCRNVLIYFDNKTKEKVINRLCGNLRPGGYFFLGHSESLQGISTPLEQLWPTVFTLK